MPNHMIKLIRYFDDGETITDMYDASQAISMGSVLLEYGRAALARLPSTPNMQIVK